MGREFVTWWSGGLLVRQSLDRFLRRPPGFDWDDGVQGRGCWTSGLLMVIEVVKLYQPPGRRDEQIPDDLDL